MDNNQNFNEETVDLYSFTEPKKAGKSKRQAIRKKVNIIASIVLTISIFFTSIFGAGIWLLSQRINDDSMQEEGDFEDLIYSTSSKSSYILVVGVDPQETLTDIIIVACIDHEKNTLNFLQIPRDTYIGDDVPTKKVNAVFGNPRKGEKEINALRRRLSSYFGIPLDHYVKFTIKGFSNIIDALGGVEVNIETPNKNGIFIMDPFTMTPERIGPGLTNLTGPQAVGFVRKRTGVSDGYVKGDIDRIEAQREVYVALAKKLQSMSVGQMTTIAKTSYNEVATDMSISQILGYALEVRSIPMDSMGIYAVPGQFATYNKLSMWSPHKDEYINIFNTYFNPYGDPITTDDIQMIELHKKLGNATRPSEVEQGGALSNVKK